MSDMNTIDILEPGHPEYDNADFLESEVSATAFLDSIAQAYNKGLEVGAIAFIPLPDRLRPYNFKRCILNRGLEDGVDILMMTAKTDASGRVLPKNRKMVKMKRLSDSEIRIIGAD